MGDVKGPTSSGQYTSNVEYDVPSQYNEMEVPKVQSYSGKQGGYTEAEINVLKGKGNEERPEYDLGKDGAFGDFRILVGCFYSEVFFRLENQHRRRALSKRL
jgi:hypothetical protein